MFTDNFNDLQENLLRTMNYTPAIHLELQSGCLVW